jgi:hypothetical protein
MVDCVEECGKVKQRYHARYQRLDLMNPLNCELNPKDPVQFRRLKRQKELKIVEELSWCEARERWLPFGVPSKCRKQEQESRQKLNDYLASLNK